jgi:hypothetical protein
LSKYDVITPFKDKNSKESYGVGDPYETKDKDRVKFLQQEGFLGEMVEASAPDPDEPEAKEEPKPSDNSKKKKKTSKESQGSDE